MKNILIFIALVLCFAVHFGESQKNCHGGCQSFGSNPKCITKGNTWLKDCVTYKCQYKNNIMTLAPDKIQCQTDDPRPICIKKGKTWTKDCITYQCAVNGNKAKWNPMKAKCKVGKTCYAEGQSFPYTINNVRYKNCKCQIKGSSRKISCTT